LKQKSYIFLKTSRRRTPLRALLFGLVGGLAIAPQAIPQTLQNLRAHACIKANAAPAFPSRNSLQLPPSTPTYPP
jgi:hypothetical protein